MNRISNRQQKGCRNFRIYPAWCRFTEPLLGEESNSQRGKLSSWSSYSE